MVLKDYIIGTLKIRMEIGICVPEAYNNTLRGNIITFLNRKHTITGQSFYQNYRTSNNKSTQDTVSQSV